jgi:hypothetical protein
MASIDSQRVNENNIVIEQDTNITVTFSLYDVDYMEPTDNTSAPTAVIKQTVNNNPWPGPTDQFYASYNIKQIGQLSFINVHFVEFYKWYDDGLGDFQPGTFVCDNTTSNGHPEIEFKVNIAYLDPIMLDLVVLTLVIGIQMTSMTLKWTMYR